MRRLLHRRPSPAFVIATIALFLAAGGTTYALTIPAGSVGTAQLTPGAVSNSKLRTGQVTNSKLARNTVTFSKLAKGQFTNESIRNGTLTGDDLAAKTVTGANINLQTVGRYASVATNNTFVQQSGQITIKAQDATSTVLDFGAPMAGKPLLVAVDGGQPGFVTAAPCGGQSAANPSGVTCPAAVNTTSHVRVLTFDATGAPAGRAFTLVSPQG